MKKIVIGILAHVDAGKTTLSESMLYLSGKIKKLGRVDNKDAYLDTYELERARGITIFSKQAILETEKMQMTLLDTPGHVDFSAEMERTLQVLDYAILVISGADGVQGHTKTLWRLLERYQIPVFLFINKMDQPGTNKEALLEELKTNLNDGCIDFTQTETEEFYDQIAMCDEKLMDEFLDTGSIEEFKIIDEIKERKIFPCFFGSALKTDGVEEFMDGIARFAKMAIYPDEFGAKIFKIARDEQGTRLTYLKVTGGSLKVKMPLTNQADGRKAEEVWEEKVNQIRLYSGEKYEAVNEVEAGSICAVTGLTMTKPGEGLGREAASIVPVLEPVLSYQIILVDGLDPRMVLPKLKQLEEEIPELHIVWNEKLQEIQAMLMGEVQIEIIKSMIAERFQIAVEFGEGNIVYKETIANTVEGVGHFEPLRHYAEVHLLLEPGERGSGMQFATSCSEDELDKNWQRLIMTHLEEKEHRGVLTGSYITDMKITLVAGRAHKKHTEGGDFREATYRAIRQGLKEAESVLLEPYYEFRLELPNQMVGRAMNDVEKMCGTCELTQNEGEMAVLTGSAPVVTMRNYQQEVIAYSKGHGRLFCTMKGYEKCHNTEEVIEAMEYDSERDIMNPTGSVFCAHGAGFLVTWDEVKDYMHVESVLKEKKETALTQKRVLEVEEEPDWIGTDEIDEIIARTFYANTGNNMAWKKNREKAKDYSSGPTTFSAPRKEKKEEYLLVDGYNVIFAWESLNELAKINIDSARGKLQDILCNYQAIRKCELIVVFDAYRIEGHQTEIFNYHNIHVVYTKEAETADQYIEKFAQQHGHKYDVTVATSDGLEQIIIRGKGCQLLSARDLEKEVKRANEITMKAYEEKKQGKNFLFDQLSKEAGAEIETYLKNIIE
ncbi:ribosome protection-type tetracycline resistance related proteins, group 2 [Lachnospiraceae bacterium KM106-2]|nr:ribosome protection-type tetracycline resistance related proteins, group 2 [Lachnospiraceae bacterium KM106-2]